MGEGVHKGDNSHRDYSLQGALQGMNQKGVGINIQVVSKNINNSGHFYSMGSNNSNNNSGTISHRQGRAHCAF